MRLVVADDSALFREGLCGLLERRGHTIVATAATAPELSETVRAAAARGEVPDLVITDVRMPPTMSDDGLRAAVDLRREFPSLGIMVLSQYVAPAYARELFHPAAGTGGNGAAVTHVSGNEDDAPGGLGYLLKDRVARGGFRAVPGNCGGGWRGCGSGCCGPINGDDAVTSYRAHLPRT